MGSLDGSDDRLFWDLERENSLGGERGERVGEKGISCDVFSGEVCLEGAEVVFFGGGVIFLFQGSVVGLSAVELRRLCKDFVGGRISFVFLSGGWAGDTIFLLVFLHSSSF